MKNKRIFWWSFCLTINFLACFIPPYTIFWESLNVIGTAVSIFYLIYNINEVKKLKK